MTNEPNATEPMTDAEKCKMLGEFGGYSIRISQDQDGLREYRVGRGGSYSYESSAWLSLGFHVSRDALDPVLHEIVRRGLYERYKANLLHIVANNVPMIAMITYDNMQVLATPHQLFEAAVKTVREMKGEKSGTFEKSMISRAQSDANFGKQVKP